MCSARSRVAAAWSSWPSAYCCEAVSISTVEALLLRVGTERSPASALGAVNVLNNRNKADRTGVLGIGRRLDRYWAGPRLARGCYRPGVPAEVPA
ncbi:protein of unknown function [Pseudomonas sp. JV551A1]|uniref:Uncharacterized protein n=1 Tax=Pseudomonas inefficax TaxID=2078786 RepID=A0AAQ1PA10_9PSED|nr:protein of unknown function [Pseudomonas sp. JV551A1]SPO61835.1 protein of unknown function [Pseudomonas inefficax]